MSAAPPAARARCEEVAGALCLAADAAPGARELNRALGVTDVPAVTAWYGGAPHTICGGPDPGPPYVEGYAWMRFTRAADAGASAPTELRIEAVGFDRGMDFGVPVAVGFGLPEAFAGWLAALAGRPGWTCLAAYDADRAVGGGALFVAGEQAYAGFGATLPEARGRGGQSALLARRIAIAAQQGAREVVTETGVVEPGKPSNSYRNILRAGFEEAEVRPNWDSSAAS